jgi:preprotein translocase subunit SecB
MDNIAPATLQFKEPVLVTSSFSRHNLVSGMPSNVNIEFGMTNPDNESQTVSTQISVDLVSEGQDMPFFSVAYQTVFMWDDTLSSEEAIALVRQNGQAMLISFIRGNLRGLMAYANLPAVHLQMLDLSEVQ